MTPKTEREPCDESCYAVDDLAASGRDPDNPQLTKGQLEAIFHLSPVGVFVCDSQGDFTIVNQRMAELHGFRSIGAFLAEVHHFDTHIVSKDVSFERLSRRLEEAGELLDVEIEIEQDSGERKWLSRSLRLLRDEAEDSQFILGFDVDIDQRKKIQEMEQRAISAVRHDLKTPLLSILSGVKLLRKDREESEKEDLLETIEEQGRKAMDNLEQYSNWSKMERGTYQLDSTPLDLISMIDEIVSIVEESYGGDSRLAVSVEGVNGDESGAFTVHGEKVLLENLFANLIKNAFEASPEEAPIALKLTKKDDQWELDVHNRGVVPEAMRDCFFDPYTTKGKSGGTGLGTHNAKLIAETHGGEIDFSTSQEEGTHVVVRIPINPQQTPPAPRPD